jgi:hypothetical protein
MAKTQDGVEELVEAKVLPAVLRATEAVAGAVAVVLVVVVIVVVGPKFGQLAL